MSKTLRFGDAGASELLLDVLNLLDDTAEEALVSDILDSLYVRPAALVCGPAARNGRRPAASRPLRRPWGYRTCGVRDGVAVGGDRGGMQQQAILPPEPPDASERVIDRSSRHAVGDRVPLQRLARRELSLPAGAVRWRRRRPAVPFWSSVSTSPLRMPARGAC